MDEFDEPLDAGDHEVPVDLLELYEILSWEAAVAAEGGNDGKSSA